MKRIRIGQSASVANQGTSLNLVDFATFDFSFCRYRGAAELSRLAILDSQSIASDLASRASSSTLNLAAPIESRPQTSTVYDVSPAISQLDLLMADAQHPTKNKSALRKVRSLIRSANRTPNNERTPKQLHLLAKWRKPSRASTSSLPLGAAPSSRPISSFGKTPQIFVDASAHGIGFIFNERWLAWTFTTNHPSIPLGPNGKIITSWAELIAVELGLLTLIAAGYRDTKIKIKSDNEGVVNALQKGRWMPLYDLDAILQRILDLCKERRLVLEAAWIPTKENPADHPSRGVYPKRELMFEHSPEVPQHLVGLVEAVDSSSLSV